MLRYRHTDAGGIATLTGHFNFRGWAFSASQPGVPFVCARWMRRNRWSAV